MGLEIIVSLLALLGFGIGIAGMIVPVIPGAITIIVAVLIWALIIGGWQAWLVFGIVTLLSIIGASFSYVFTGKKLKEKAIPNWVLLGAAIGAIVGIFVIPGPGLLIGFIVGLLIAEFARLKDFSQAVNSTAVALKALGIGILVEISLAAISATIFVISAILIIAF